jgi:flagellin
MGLRINQNIAAQNAYRNLSITDSQMSKSLEKLSSGFRINRAADDAAGLSISEGLRSQIGGLKVAVRNTQDGISAAQTAEGSLNEVTSILQRMRDLAVQSANTGGTDKDAAAAAQKEMVQLNQELDRIGNNTSFSKSKLLDGSFGATKTVVGTQIPADKLTKPPAALVAPLPSATFVPAGSPAGTNTPWTFDITEIAGATTMPDGSPIAITVSVDQLPAGATPQDLSKAVNLAISGALKQNGFQGNEISMTAKVDTGNNTTFQMSGASDFAITDSAGVLQSLQITAAGDIDPTTDLTGTGGNTGAFQVGANANQKINIQIGAVNSETLGTASLDLTADPDYAISILDSALGSVSDERAQLGAYQNRFDHTVNNLNVAVENLSASESRIRDTDMAQEMVSFTRAQILTQAGTSMLAQANQSAQNVLKLLQ